MSKKNKLVFEAIKMWKVYDPEERDFVNALFLVTIEFNTEEYLRRQPCACDYGQDVDAHEFMKMDSGVFIKCKVQGSTYGLLPTVEKGKAYPWVKIVKKKEITKAEARRLFTSKKFVATPDIIIFLMKGKMW